MRLRATSLFASVAIAAASAAAPAWADEPATTAPEDNPEAQAPQAKPEEPAPQTPAEVRADLYTRLAAAKDSDETEGIIGLLLHSYAESGSDTGDLLLQRARKAMGESEYDDARKILDVTVALLPDWAEGWNARATVRYLDDDYEGSMADIAQTSSASRDISARSWGWERFWKRRVNANRRLRSMTGCSPSRRIGATPRSVPTSSKRRWRDRSFDGPRALGPGSGVRAPRAHFQRNHPPAERRRSSVSAKKGLTRER